ncbi:MAG: tyrosine-type recombinase/integrase [Clostridium sp.]
MSSGGVRKRGASWYYRFYDNGTQIERKGGSTKKEALEKLNEELNRQFKGYDRPSEMLLNDYFEMWLDDYVKYDKAENTYDKYKCCYENKIKKLIGSIQLCNLKVLHIEKYIRDLKKSKLSANSIQFYYSVLNTALNKAVKLQLLIDNPCKYVDTPKRGRYKASVLTIEEFNKVYAKLNSEDYEDYIMQLALDVALELGVRRGEMCAFEWKDIDFENNTIDINKSLIRVGNIFKISIPKTESSYRILPLSDYIINKLLLHKTIQKKNKLLYGPHYKKNTWDNKTYDLIFTWDNGRYVKPHNFLQRLKRLCKSCDIDKNIRWHDLRHSNATLLLEGGVDMKTLQDRLGHSMMQTTADTYSHVTEKMNRKATDVISSLRSSS